MLVLRNFEIADKPVIIDILNDPEVTRFLSSRIPFPYADSDADWWLSVGCKNGIIRAIEVDGNFAGCIGIEPGQNEYAFTGELGYWLARKHWGKGIVTEALRTLLAQIKRNNFARVQATVFQGNTASESVLLKCGFKKEGNLEKAVYKHQAFYNAVLYGKVIS